MLFTLFAISTIGSTELIQCGNNSDDLFEQIADCDRVLGKKSRSCILSYDLYSYPFDCAHWDKLYEEGFSLEEKAVSKYGPRVLTRTTLRVTPKNSNKKPNDLHISYPKTSMCGFEGTLKERISDCAQTIGQTSSICTLKLNPNTTRLINCDLADAFNSSSQLVHKWHTVSVNEKSERIWYQENSKMIWSSKGEVNHLFGSISRCQSPNKFKIQKANIEGFKLATCNEIAKAYADHGAALVFDSEMMSNAKLWCDSQTSFLYFDVESKAFKENSPLGSPANAALCTKSLY